jgi:hypothetical protein
MQALQSSKPLSNRAARMITGTARSQSAVAQSQRSATLFDSFQNETALGLVSRTRFFRREDHRLYTWLAKPA